MIHINLLPKPIKKESIKRTKNAIRAARKLIQWHSDNIIQAQEEQISCLKSILRIHGVVLD